MRICHLWNGFCLLGGIMSNKSLPQGSPKVKTHHNHKGMEGVGAFWPGGSMPGRNTPTPGSPWPHTGKTTLEAVAKAEPSVEKEDYTREEIISGRIKLCRVIGFIPHLKESSCPTTLLEKSFPALRGKARVIRGEEKTNKNRLAERKKSK